MNRIIPVLMAKENRARNAEEDRDKLEDYYKAQIEIAKDLIVENYRQAKILNELRKNYMGIKRQLDNRDKKIERLQEWKEYRCKKLKQMIKTRWIGLGKGKK